MRGRRPLLPRLRSLPVLALVVGNAVGVAGQGIHPVPLGPRPVHERLALADAAAVVRVESLATGRLFAVRLRTLLGSPPEEFPIKRAPSNPPPLEPGDRALVLLRGARPPYVLVDEPRETIRLADDAMAERWGDAFARVVESRDAPRALASEYLAWLDAGPESLRELGTNGLLDLIRDAPDLQPWIARNRALAAADAARSAETRRVSALLAVSTPEGAGSLVEQLLAADLPADSSLWIGPVLRGAAAHRSPGLASLFGRVLAHGDPAVRRAGLQVAPAVLRADATLRDAVSDVAEHDPNEQLRRDAERTLRSVPAS